MTNKVHFLKLNDNYWVMWDPSRWKICLFFFLKNKLQYRARSGLRATCCQPRSSGWSGTTKCIKYVYMFCFISFGLTFHFLFSLSLLLLFYVVFFLHHAIKKTSRTPWRQQSLGARPCAWLGENIRCAEIDNPGK